MGNVESRCARLRSCNKASVLDQGEVGLKSSKICALLWENSSELLTCLKCRSISRRFSQMNAKYSLASRLTIHVSRLTPHASQFTSRVSRLTIHVSRVSLAAHHHFPAQPAQFGAEIGNAQVEAAEQE